MQHADTGRKRVCAYACSRTLCVLHLRPVRLLRISHSWRFGEGVTGRGRTARNRVQGNTRLDRRTKPDGLRAEASGSAEHWRSEVDYGFIYRDCEVVMKMHATLHDFSFSDEELLHLGNQCASYARPVARLSSLAVVRQFPHFQLLQRHHLKFWQRCLLKSQQLTEPQIWPGSCP